MEINIIGAESLGVRSMACLVRTGARLILIDPGVALAPRRFGFPPHPGEIKRAALIRQQILNHLPQITDIIISHFHGDHTPLKKPDPFQIPLIDFKNRLGTSRIYIKSNQGNTSLMNYRYSEFVAEFASQIIIADRHTEPGLEFSAPVPHGEPHQGTVLMTKITDQTGVFVHASDIQLLNETAINALLVWQPDILFVAGPPIYLPQLSPAQLNRAFENAIQLARVTKTLILDHHLLRSTSGLRWLAQLRQSVSIRVICAAEWQLEKPDLLEARRRQLFSLFPN